MLLHLEQLGLVDYAAALELQKEKVAQRKAGAIPDTLLLLEHPHVYTLGRNARQENMLVSEEFLASRGAQVFPTDRGGDVTYHGPGQLVGYPILDLTRHQRDISWYMRSLEEVFIRTANDYGIEAGRSKGAAGVWVGDDKLTAMGVHLSRWVTSHGFAMNVNTDLRYFEHPSPNCSATRWKCKRSRNEWWSTLGKCSGWRCWQSSTRMLKVKYRSSGGFTGCGKTYQTVILRCQQATKNLALY
jgi:lipoyl(octanoyl) transferase